MIFLLSFITWVFLLSLARCDTPANCTYEDVEGHWLLLESSRDSNSSIDCTNFNGTFTHDTSVTLLFPNVAFDSVGNKGYWTIIYNQGFEVVINYRKYFAFFNYKTDSGGNVTSLCHEATPGWSHDVLGKNWACYGAVKGKLAKVESFSHKRAHFPSFDENQRFLAVYEEKSMADQINRKQSSWRAFMYPDLITMSADELVRRAGGLKSIIYSPPPTAPANYKLIKMAGSLPEEFDWRNMSGINYVSPVRNQGSCGSCYAFSSLAMLESRLRIMTNNTVQVQFSPQDIVSCSPYSQGCEGGFPYAIAGKYSQDFGLLPEECYPYKGKDSGCTKKNCKRFYVAEYEYVGGFFGGCNEELMKLELVKRGPLTVAFEVYPDFMLYQSGIYYHTGVESKFNPLKLVNHGVLITGYGADRQTGERYWIVKNSWGTGWGEGGYFRIRRGTNECNIESMAVSAIPIP